MSNNNDCGIYKITNNINGKIYIGKSVHLHRRWVEHKNASNNLQKQNSLYRAFRKYGINNFNFEIIELCPLDNAFLTQRECYWIDYYNSYQNGYNETRGGEGHYKYSKEEIYSLWDEGYSVLEITNTLHCEEQVVYDNLNNYDTYSTEEAKKRAEPKRREQIRIKAIERQGYPIYQYDLEGNFIKEYPNLSSAANAFGYKKDNSISKVLNDKTGKRKIAYGFQWRREKYDKIEPYHAIGKRIAIRNKNTGLIFISIRQAAKYFNIDKNLISQALKGLKEYAGILPETKEKLYWEYY